MAGGVTTYAGLRKALAARRRALGMTQEAMNDRANLQGGYVNKLECGSRHFGDMSFDAVMKALGVEIVLVPVVNRRSKQNSASVRTETGSSNQTVGDKPVGEKKIVMTAQEKGGRARAEKLSPERRAQIASKAAKARWAEHFKGKKRAALPAGVAENRKLRRPIARIGAGAGLDCTGGNEPPDVGFD